MQRLSASGGVQVGTAVTWGVLPALSKASRDNTCRKSEEGPGSGDLSWNNLLRMGDADCSAVFGPGGGTVCAQVHAVREFSRFGTLLPLLSSHCYHTPVALGSLCLPECGMDSICLSCAVPYVKCHVYVLEGSNIPSSGRVYSDVHII